MFKKGLLISSLTFCLFVPFVLKADGGGLYRNDEYHFRIKFPTGWEVKNGDGINVVKKAANNGSTVLVLVRDFYESLSEKDRMGLPESTKGDFRALEMSDYSEKEAMEFIDELATTLLEAFPGSSVLEKEMRHIDNRRAVYLKINQVYKVQNRTVEGIMLYYSTIHRGKLYQIQGFYPKGSEYQESTIEKSMATFVFEDWNEPVGISDADSSSSGNQKKTFVESFQEGNGSFVLIFVKAVLFTWVLGLMISLLLRFVFLKRPLSKWVALFVAGFIYAIQLMIATGMSGKLTGHQSLILVAVVSYWILRREVNDGVNLSEAVFKKNGEQKIQNNANDDTLNVEQITVLDRSHCCECGNLMKNASIFCSKCGKKREAKN